MQPDELADVVVLTIKASLAPVLSRLTVLESVTASVPAVEQSVTALSAKVAEMHAAPVPDTDAIAQFETRLAAVEARPVVEQEAIPLEDLAASFTGLLRKELEVRSPAAGPMQKRVIRDQAGRVERVIEEPVT